MSVWMCIYSLYLNGSSLNKVPSFPFTGKSLQYAGKVVSDSALLCLSRVELWSPEGGDKREAEKQSLYKPSTLTPSMLLMHVED